MQRRPLRSTFDAPVHHQYHEDDCKVAPDGAGLPGRVQLTGAFFSLAFLDERRSATMIAAQRDVMDGLAASADGISGNRHLRLARLAIAAGTAVALVGLYIGTKHFFSIEGVAAEQSRVYRLDIGESCLNGTAEAPLFEAREGDRVVLAVTSLYSGEFYLHGLERETRLVPGSETTITFTAAHAGRYYLHLHGADENHPHAEVAVLEVAPR
jgi:hypothetical protein